MKKLSFAALFAACVLSLAAQTGGGASTGLLNVHQYSSYFLDRDKKLDLDYELAVEDNDYYDNVAKLGGSQTLVDTPLEIAMLSFSAGVVGIRPAKAVEMLPASNPRLADLKLGAATYMDMQMARFSGKDPAPYAVALKFITDRGNISEADIKKFMAQGIAAEVDAQFNRVSFLLENSRTYSSARSHNAVLTRNPQNGQYILSYGGTYTNDETRTVTGNSLDALSSEMRNGKYKTDFDETGISTVRAQAALIPAAVFDGWKRATPNMVNPYELLTQALTDFYVTPSRANYEVICGIQARSMLAVIADGDAFTEAMENSIHQTLATLNYGLYEKVAKDLSPNGALIVATGKPDDPRYGIFTLTKTVGDAIFVSKRTPATGLLVSY